MYYYKHIDENGNIFSLESRNSKAVNPPDTMVEITEEEYVSIRQEIQESNQQEISDEISGDEFLAMLEGALLQ